MTAEVFVDRKVAALAKIAQPDDPRPALQNICITGTHAAAADGYVLMIVELPNPMGTDPGPTLPKPVALDAKQLKEVVGTAERPKKGVERHLTWTRLSPTDDGKIKANNTNGANHEVVLEPYPGAYPDYRQIIDSVEAVDPNVTVAISAKRLHTLLGAILEAAGNPKDDLPVQFEVRGPNRACVFRTTEQDELRKITGVIMPMVIGGK